MLRSLLTPSASMSFLDEIASVASGAMSGNYAEIVSKVEQGIQENAASNSPLAQQVVALIKKEFPQLEGKADLVQEIDDLIPDSIQSSFGFTPAVMTFIKEALGSHQATLKAE